MWATVKNTFIYVMAEFKSELIVLHVYPFLRSLQSQKALFTEGNSFSNIQEEFWHVYQPGCSEGIWVVVGFYVGLRIVWPTFTSKTIPFSRVWYLQSISVVQASSFSQTLVCRPKMILFYFGMYLAFIYLFIYFVCVCKASSVVRSFRPMSPVGDIPLFTVIFGLIRYERRNAFNISSVVVSYPFAFYRGPLKVFQNHLAWPLDCGVVGWWPNMCDAAWTVEVLAGYVGWIVI